MSVALHPDDNKLLYVGSNGHGLWFSKDAGRDETYNYLYDAGELDGLVARVRELAKMSATLTVIANNHYQGKEAVNALEIKARISGGPVRVPPLLMEKYPRLEAVARPS